MTLPSDRYDVVIVGASIAGCASALLFAAAGAAVVVVDRQTETASFKRICTHQIQGSAIPVLDRLGLTDRLLAAGATPSATNLWTRYGWLASDGETHRPGLPGLNVRRETLDPIIRSAAEQDPNVSLVLGERLHSLITGPGRGAHPAKTVYGVRTVDRQGSVREIRARLVVGADGASSALAASAGLPARRRKIGRFGFFGYYRDTPIAAGDNSQIYFLDPDILYAFPTDGGLTLLACMVHARRWDDFAGDPEAAMAAMFAAAVDAPALDPSRRVGDLLGRRVGYQTLRPTVGRNVALVGDAAMQFDHLWGLGCGNALRSAEWLVDAAAPALARGDDTLTGPLRRYAARHRRALLPSLAFTAAYAGGRRFNPAERLLYRGGVHDGRVARALVDFGDQWIGPHRLASPILLGRAVSASLRHGSRPSLSKPRHSG